MMLPSSLPLIRLFGRASANQPRPRAAKAAFLGGYVAVWSGFGAVAFLGDLGVHRLVDRSAWLAARPACSAARSWCWRARSSSPSSRTAACGCAGTRPATCGGTTGGARRRPSRLGAGHGVWCVGCCWALMLVAFAAGVANLWWMAALTAVMVFEKTGREGRRGVRPIGVGLIVLGLLMLAARPPDSDPGRCGHAGRRIEPQEVRHAPKLALAAVLAVLAGGVMAASVATAAPPTRRPPCGPGARGPRPPRPPPSRPP